MANTCYLASSSYQGRYLYISCTQTPDINTNSSRIDWTLVSTGGSANYYTTGATTVLINGEQVYYKQRLYWDSYTFPAGKGSTSGSLIVPHDENGKATISVKLSTAIYTSVISSYETTWELDEINRFTTITEAPNFNDEENPVINYFNPVGNAVESLQACISLDGSKDDIAYRDISKTGSSYTFNLTESERDILRTATTGSTSRKIKFYIKSVISGKTKFEVAERNFNVINAAPQLNVLVMDTNQKTVALTGDSLTTLIKGYSTASYEMSATALKGAAITEYKATSNSIVKTTDSGAFTETESGSFSFYVKDNREQSATKTITLNLIDYFKPTCNAEVELELDGETTIRANIKASGSFFNGSFGYAKNSLRALIKHSGAEGWVNLADAYIEPVASGNSYTLEFGISGLDYTKPFTYQLKIVDALDEAFSAEETVSYNPVFDWGAEDFNFNVPIHMSGNTVLRYTDTNRVVLSANGGDIYLRPNGTTTDAAQLRLMTDGKATLNGSRVLTFDLVYPVGAVYISAANTNPSGIFGGTWASITNSLGVYMWKRTA